MKQVLPLKISCMSRMKKLSRDIAIQTARYSKKQTVIHNAEAEERSKPKVPTTSKKSLQTPQTEKPIFDGINNK